MQSELRAQRQLRLIQELVELLQAASIRCWLRGGWAHDFFLGEVTRVHDDIDLFVWASDSDAVGQMLARSGFTERNGLRSAGQRVFRMEGEEIHVALLERTSDGRLVTPAGRWAARLGLEPSDAAPEEWPTEMLDGPPGRLVNITVPIVTPAAQVHAIESAARMPGHPLSEKHRKDLIRLRERLSAT